jgi:hypothetical protein
MEAARAVLALSRAMRHDHVAEARHVGGSEQRGVVATRGGQPLRASSAAGGHQHECQGRSAA